MTEKGALKLFQQLHSSGRSDAAVHEAANQ